MWIIFLRKIISGGASRSYGIQVGRLAGLPEEVIRRAKEILQNLEAGEFGRSGEPRLGKSRHQPKRKPASQMSLFQTDPDSVIRTRLEAADLSCMTPIDAMNLLNELKELL